MTDQIKKMIQSSGRNQPFFNSSLDGAARFALMFAVRKSALAQEWAELDKTFQQLLRADVPQVEFPDAW